MTLKLTRLFCLFTACMISSLPLSGCSSGGGDDTEELVPVSGQVMMEGSPLAGASVRFEPVDGQSGTTCFGTTDAEGKFVLKNRHGREGCGVGSFTVVITKFAKPDGSPIGEDEDPITVDAKEFLPEKYSNSEKSELRAEVPDGGKTFDFSLDGGKK